MADVLSNYRHRLLTLIPNYSLCLWTEKYFYFTVGENKDEDLHNFPWLEGWEEIAKKKHKSTMNAMNVFVPLCFVAEPG